MLVGPVFVPFFIVPKLEWLFWGWLRCFLQYAFYEVIAAAVVYIVGNLIIGVLNAHKEPGGHMSNSESAVSIQSTATSSAPSSLSTDTLSSRLTEYEFIDSRELARRLTVPTSWIRDQVRARSEDPLPHVNLGKHVRFLWGSPALELWIRRRIVVGNNRRLGRTRRKEKE